MMKFIDLFAGIGGTRIGFQQALKANNLKGNCIFTSEIKPHAIYIYHKNFKAPKQITGNIKKVNAKNIPDFNYLLGGFPCQSFSTAGKQLGFKDTRGTLFFDVARILKAKQPKGFLLENVPHLLNHDGGRTFHVIHRVLMQLGYSVGYTILDSSYFGLAQKRKRLYIIGVKSKHPKEINMNDIKGNNHKVRVKDIINYQDNPIHDNFSKKLLTHYKLQDIIGKRIRDNRSSNYNIHSWNFNAKGKTTKAERALLNKLIPECRQHKWAKIYGIKWSDGMPLTEKMIKTFDYNKNLHLMLKDLTNKHYLTYNYPKQTINHHRTYVKAVPKGYKIVSGALSEEYNKILDPNGFTTTLTATDMNKLAIPVNNGIRPLDWQEGLRLFGFPKWYNMQGISKNKQDDLIGNTVCVPVIKAVANKLLSISRNKEE